jgi:MoaA/NifB/PqqE/SkfB family radical SAM enzyme
MSRKKPAAPDVMPKLTRIRKKAGRLKRELLQRFEKCLARKAPGLLLELFPPSAVIIEPTNICNLRCPLCPTSQSKREKGRMPLEALRKIAAGLPPSIQTSHLYLSGEPLLHYDCFAMVSELSRLGLKTSLSTNGTRLGRCVDEILDSQLDELIIALDGAERQTYERYRIGADFDSVVDNIRRLVIAKRALNLHRPRIVLQCLVTRDTEPELGAVQELARDLGVDALSFISASLGTHHTDAATRRLLAERFLPQDASFCRYERSLKGDYVLKWKRPYCPLWRLPVILWNGDVTACCFDHDGIEVYGNVLERSFRDVWCGADHVSVVQRMLPRKMTICETCGITSGDENRHIPLPH